MITYTRKHHDAWLAEIIPYITLQTGNQICKHAATVYVAGINPYRVIVKDLLGNMKVLLTIYSTELPIIIFNESPLQ